MISYFLFPIFYRLDHHRNIKYIYMREKLKWVSCCPLFQFPPPFILPFPLFPFKNLCRCFFFIKKKPHPFPIYCMLKEDPSSSSPSTKFYLLGEIPHHRTSSRLSTCCPLSLLLSKRGSSISAGSPEEGSGQLSWMGISWP
jgi:hypothetical protein